MMICKSASHHHLMNAYSMTTSMMKLVLLPKKMSACGTSVLMTVNVMVLDTAKMGGV